MKKVCYFHKMSGGKKVKRKTETELGGLREGRCDGSGRGVQNEGEKYGGWETAMKREE